MTSTEHEVLTGSISSAETENILCGNPEYPRKMITKFLHQI
jgi:hypothetical protein